MNTPFSFQGLYEIITSQIRKRDVTKLSLSFDTDRIIMGSNKRSYLESDYEKLWRDVTEFDSKSLALISKNRIEMLIRVESPRAPQRYILERFLDDILIDSEEGVKYEINKASFQIMINLLAIIKDRKIELGRIPFLFLGHEEQNENITLEELAFKILRYPYTVSITSESDISKRKLQQLCCSFMFTCSYNFGVAFREIVSLEDMLGSHIPLKRSSRRRQSVSDMPLPQRIFTPELIDQYNMGLSTNDPFIEFLCFYHVIEHFFDKVYREDFIKTIQLEITSPKFSAKKSKDINKLIETIRKKWNSGENEFRQDEERALALALKKFIPSLERLKDDISELDSEAVVYYSTQQVAFSKGEKIDFNDCSQEKVYTQIASRIYKTRNAIVHNKANDLREQARGIYRPFSDKEDLAKEIPLIQVIAETVIIFNSSIIE